MPLTLSDVANNVAAKLARTDATTRGHIEAQIKAAIRHYRRRPWHFVEMREGSLTLAANTVFYSSIDFSSSVGPLNGGPSGEALASVSVADIIDFDNVEISGSYVDRVEMVSYEAFNRMRDGGAINETEPSFWTRYGDQIGFYGTPSAATVLKVSAPVRPIVPTGSGSNSIFFEEALDLIEARTAERVCALHLRNTAQASVHRVDRMEQESALNTEFRRRRSPGRVTPVY